MTKIVCFFLAVHHAIEGNVLILIVLLWIIFGIQFKENASGR